MGLTRGLRGNHKVLRTKYKLYSLFKIAIGYTCNEYFLFGVMIDSTLF